MCLACTDLVYLECVIFSKEQSPVSEFPFSLFLVYVVIAQSVQRLATGRAVRSQNTGGGKIFRTHPHWPWGPISRPCNGQRDLYLWVQGPGRGVDYSSPSSAEVQEKVECTSIPALRLHGILQDIFYLTIFLFQFHVENYYLEFYGYLSTRFLY